MTCAPISTESGDEAFECTPADGDDACESFADGGPALVLWPPNHELITVSLADCAAVVDDCAIELSSDPAGNGHITAITSDEPVDVGQGGDGATKTYDMKIVDATTVEVRSERQGGGDGRIYRVFFEDAFGAPGSCEIHVPHDQRPYGGATDSGTAVQIDR